jgi:inner membrane protein
MATIIMHPLVPLALWAGLGRHRISNSLLALACVASVLPDADVLGFFYGIPYASQFGHRGFTHSIAFAIAIGFCGFSLRRVLDSTGTISFLVPGIATLSHGLLDALTNGGLGVAFFWPLSDVRYFLPWQPLEVSPIGLSRFFTPRGFQVLLSEFIWIGTPLVSIAVAAFIARRRKRKDRTQVL